MSFFKEFTSSLKHQARPANLAASLVLLSVGAIAGVGMGVANRKLVRPRRIRKWVESDLTWAAIEARVVSAGYASTDNEAQAVIAEWHLDEDLPLPARYARFQKLSRETEAQAAAAAS